MQRLTKYSLLLKAVHKNTENEEQRAELTHMVKEIITNTLVLYDCYFTLETVTDQICRRLRGVCECSIEEERGDSAVGQRCISNRKLRCGRVERRRIGETD